MRTRFREAMIEHLDRAGMTSAELARRSGVPKTLIDKLRQMPIWRGTIRHARRLITPVSEVWRASIASIISVDYSI